MRNILNKITFIFSLLSIAIACEPAKTTEEMPVESQPEDFVSFMENVFPGYDFKSDKDVSYKTFDLQSNRKLTIIQQTSPREALVVWIEEEGKFKNLYSCHRGAGEVEQVLEHDLNDDQKPDLIITSCREYSFPYTDIIMNLSTEKKTEYRSVLMNPYVLPLILDLNHDKRAEIVTVVSDKFPFNLTNDNFEEIKTTFFRNTSTLLEIQNHSFISGYNTFCEADHNTPMLVGYPIVIYNIAVNTKPVGFVQLKDVTKEFPDIMKLQLETVYDSDLKLTNANPLMETAWKDYLLSYFDYYYTLKTDSSYLKYLRSVRTSD